MTAFTCFEVVGKGSPVDLRVEAGIRIHVVHDLLVVVVLVIPLPLSIPSELKLGFNFEERISSMNTIVCKSINM